MDVALIFNIHFVICTLYNFYNLSVFECASNISSINKKNKYDVEMLFFFCCRFLLLAYDKIQ